ncbi:hypothetical protein BD311DRAFT_271739 [Dichomitus squalens]|uniref:Uncharacterized protein n=1 Tax=Dichomitus squalens TaxID=114155 RepID=A0A4Q9MNY1_9APHY|nr:hypothetical protein BD311DRAFT_271739 [Dichomitus squalens]TBU54381.1 hypothetical protein BD310DRAFT_936037 [Dichomitus squalens]
MIRPGQAVIEAGPPFRSYPQWTTSMFTPVGCPLCSTTLLAPTPLPTLIQPFSFTIVPNCLTCTSMTIKWRYTGPQRPFTLVVHEFNPFKIRPLTRFSQTRREDTASFLVASGLDSTDLIFTWPIVDVTSGYYKLHATGNGFSVASPEFFVGAGINTSCLSVPPPPAPPFTTHVSTLPTSDLFVSTAVRDVGGPTPSPAAIPLVSSSQTAITEQTGAIIGGLAGGTALFAVAGFLVYRLCKRRSPLRIHRLGFLKSGEATNQEFDIASRPPSISSDEERADHHNQKQELELLSGVARPPRSMYASAMMFIASDVVEPPASDSRSAMDAEVESQRSLTLAVLSTNAHATSTAAPAISVRPPSSPPPPSTTSTSSPVHTRRYRNTPTALALYTPPPNSLHSSYVSSGSGAGSGGMTITTSPAPSSATSQMYRIRDSAWGEWASMRPSATVRASASAETETEVDDERHISMKIVHAQRAVVAAGEIRAVRMDLPETPFPLSPDFR